MRPTLAIAVAALAAALSTACNDGAHIFGETLERAPVIPKPPTARTTPLSDFDTPGTPLGAPTGGYGPGTGTGGLGVVRTDPGESSSQTSLEDGDAVVCDPANHRVILLKSRARGTTLTAEVFASSAALGSLDGAAGVYIAEPTVSTRRVIVSTSAGYAVMPESGAPVSAHAVTGGPFGAITVFEGSHALFLAAGNSIRRVGLDSSGSDFDPANGSASDVLYTGAAPILGLAEGLNGDLLFTEGATLKRIPSAGTVAAPAPVNLTVITLDAGEVAGGVCVDSGRNAVIAVDRTAVGSGAPGRLVEALLTVTNQAASSAVSSVTLTAAPRAVAIDGKHGAFMVAFAAEVLPLVESAPDLTERIQTLFNARGCIGCHPVVNPAIDLSTAQRSFDTLVNQTVSGGCLGAAAVYVSPGDAASSLLTKKVEGRRDGTTLAACGSRMPQGLRPITAVEIDSIRRWIASGAAR